MELKLQENVRMLNSESKTMAGETNIARIFHSESARFEELQERVAHLEAKLAQADRYIVNALESSVGFEDMSRKLRAAHAMLKEALRS
jgi:hypothetical protein